VEHGTHNATYDFYLDVPTSNLYFDVPIGNDLVAKVALSTLEGSANQILDSHTTYAYGLRVVPSRNIFFWFGQLVVNTTARGTKIIVGPMTPPGGPMPVSRSVALEWCVVDSVHSVPLRFSRCVGGGRHREMDCVASCRFASVGRLVGQIMPSCPSNHRAGDAALSQVLPW
jgi:hypothetical protein